MYIYIYIYITVKYRRNICSTLCFAEQHSRTAPKVKYETAIYNSVICCSSQAKMLLMFHLSTKIFLY